MTIYQTPEGKSLTFNNWIVFAFGPYPSKYQFVEYTTDDLGINDTDIIGFQSFGDDLIYKNTFVLEDKGKSFLTIELLDISDGVAVLNPKVTILDKMKFTEGLKHKNKLKRVEKRGRNNG